MKNVLPMQVIVNSAFICHLAYREHKILLVMCVPVCFDVFSYAVAFSARQRMYVEAIIAARYNGYLKRFLLVKKLTRSEARNTRVDGKWDIHSSDIDE